MIVCLCHRISDREIQRAVREGVDDFEMLQDDTCIARNCGCCEDCARQVFDDAVAAAGPAQKPAHVIHIHRQAVTA